MTRLVGLGTPSLWLDEILQLLQVRGGLGDAWGALSRDVDHPPLDGLLTWGLARLGGGEEAQRLLRVGFGVSGLLVLVRWILRRRGLQPAAVAGVLIALAPFHVRYSQEIRPYALALLLLLVALEALDRVLEEPERRRPAGTMAVASIALVYCHYFGAAVLAATAIVWVVGALITSRPDRLLVATRAAQVGGTVAVAAVPLLPWLHDLARRPIQAGRQAWTGEAIANRLEALFFAGREGESATWPLVVVLTLVGLGTATALRSTIGRRWLVAGLMGTVGVELLLHRVDHWSNARYDLFGWPFVMVLAGLGIVLLSDTATALVPRGVARPAVAVLLTGLLCAAEIRGLVEYARRGRPRWAAVTELLDESTRGGAVPMAANEWTRVALAYHLEERGTTLHVAEVSDTYRPVEATANRVGCVVLVVGGWPASPRLRRAMRYHRVLADLEGTATVFTVRGLGPVSCPTTEAKRR